MHPRSTSMMMMMMMVMVMGCPCLLCLPCLLCRLPRLLCLPFPHSNRFTLYPQSLHLQNHHLLLLTSIIYSYISYLTIIERAVKAFLALCLDFAATLGTYLRACKDGFDFPVECPVTRVSCAMKGIPTRIGKAKFLPGHFGYGATDFTCANSLFLPVQWLLSRRSEVDHGLRVRMRVRVRGMVLRTRRRKRRS
ncbi:hypothetical protein F5878DRAFT_418190 [Lentinula raphanica]|uniref:Secreted protein n=1 Tax=Lentinula raphanica TaxID=153919 RepID=A0AA38UI73_9AGAR|nr:hypothetical protein F5878DRAFT_418190 [Lentinula raphanica]